MLESNFSRGLIHVEGGARHLLPGALQSSLNAVSLVFGLRVFYSLSFRLFFIAKVKRGSRSD
jgi:hypothetical protein